MEPARQLFTAAEEEAIRAAVAAAEQRTGGEVVPWIVAASDSYPEAAWRGATGGGLLALGLGWLAHWLSGGWGGLMVWAVLPALLGTAIGFIAGSLPEGKRLLVDDETLDRRVRLAAEAAFLRAELFATRERTGVLVFVSLLEHEVVVLGDSGIAAKVRQEEWRSIVDDIVAGIRRGEPAAALAHGVEACGRLLAERGVARAADDRNELPDLPRYGDQR